MKHGVQPLSSTQEIQAHVIHFLNSTEEKCLQQNSHHAEGAKFFWQRGRGDNTTLQLNHSSFHSVEEEL